MTYADDRQAGDEKEKGVPQIEVTPEMIEAGVKSLRFHIGVWDRDVTRDASIVAEIWKGMTALSPWCSRQAASSG